MFPEVAGVENNAVSLPQSIPQKTNLRKSERKGLANITNVIDHPQTGSIKRAPLKILIKKSPQKVKVPPQLVPVSTPAEIEKKPKKITYAHDFLLSFRECPFARIPPEGKSPQSLIDEYNEAFENEEQAFLLQEKLEQSLENLSLNKAPRKVWLPKSTVQAKRNSLEIELSAILSNSTPCSADTSINLSFSDSTSNTSLLDDLSFQDIIDSACLKSRVSQSEDPVENSPSSNPEPLPKKASKSFFSRKSLPLHRETNLIRLQARQKQIDIGKNTIGYSRYTGLVPKNKRKRGDPQTPDKYQICSKRSWDGQVRKWRRMLHHYDPEELQQSTVDDSPSDNEEEVVKDN